MARGINWVALILLVTAFVPSRAFGKIRIYDSAAKLNTEAVLTVTKTTDTNGTCNSGVDCSLREAIAAANIGDSIAFSSLFNSAQTITLTLGELSITKNLTITGPVRNNLTISGAGASRVFFITNATVTLDSLTIANGYFNGGSGGSIGGGIYNNHGTVTITNSRLVGNSATGSTGDNWGGGIFNVGSLTITGSTFIGNSVSGGNNAFARGGGIYNFGNSSVTITSSTFIGNTASGDNNGQNYGGAIFNNGGTVTLVNSTLFGNSASGSGSHNEGGGIYNTIGTMRITNGTISGNSAVSGGFFITNGGGGVSNNSGGGGTTILKNTIVAGNTGGNCISNSLSALADSLADDNTCSSATQKSFEQINLQSLANNGGLTQTMALAPGSAAIDAGDNCVFDNSCSQALAAALTTDQRGVPFARKAGNAVDIGAFELQASVFIGGRVSDANGRGQGNVVVSMAIQNGEIRMAVTNPFGYFRFYSVESGQTVTISITSKRYKFLPQTVSVNNELTDLNFTPR